MRFVQAEIVPTHGVYEIFLTFDVATENERVTGSAELGDRWKNWKNPINLFYSAFAHVGRYFVIHGEGQHTASV